LWDVVHDGLQIGVRTTWSSPAGIGGQGGDNRKDDRVYERAEGLGDAELAPDRCAILGAIELALY
jgi:hypothetical protein